MLKKILQFIKKKINNRPKHYRIKCEGAIFGFKGYGDKK